MSFITEKSEPRLHKRYGLVRETFWVGCGQALSALGAVAGVKILTQVLPPDMYGRLALSMTVVTLTHQLFVGPLAGSVLRHYAPAQQARELGAFLQGSRKLILQASAIQLVIALIVGLLITISGQAVYLPLAAAGLIFSLFSGYNAILDSFQNAARKRVIVAFHQALGQWLRFLLAAALCLALFKESFTAMLGYALAAALILISQLLFFRGEWAKEAGATDVDERRWYEQVKRYARPFAAWSLFTWLLVASDRWAIQGFGTSAEVGLYAVLYQLGYYPLNLLFGLALQVAEPVIFSRAGDSSDEKRVASVTQLIYLLTVACLAATALASLIAYKFHAEIFALMVGNAYRSVSPLLPLIMLTGGIFAAAQAASLQSMAELKPERLLKPKIITSLLGLGLNLGGAYYAGVKGVVVAGLAFSLINLIWIVSLNQYFRRSSNKEL